ncbi:MAG: hypothetical protein HY238_09675 [Acidobacteria bacterium]|nr:hypothetical protein [Acidobacteriota bacterium]
MKRTSAAVFSLLILSIVPSSLSAKGDIVKITIKGEGLTAPIEIYPNIGEFSVWVGPGVRVNGVEQTGGFNAFIIDWSKGVAAQLPTGLQHYEVSFYSGCRKGGNCRTSEPSIVYVVSYDYDPSTEQGFVYLPGKDDELYRLNTSTIFHGHGLEGNWFRATGEWEKFARPRIARARATGPNR